MLNDFLKTSLPHQSTNICYWKSEVQVETTYKPCLFMFSSVGFTTDQLPSSLTAIVIKKFFSKPQFDNKSNIWRRIIYVKGEALPISFKSNALGSDGGRSYTPKTSVFQSKINCNKFIRAHQMLFITWVEYQALTNKMWKIIRCTQISWDLDFTEILKSHSTRVG